MGKSARLTPQMAEVVLHLRFLSQSPDRSSRIYYHYK